MRPAIESRPALAARPRPRRRCPRPGPCWTSCAGPPRASPSAAWRRRGSTRSCWSRTCWRLPRVQLYVQFDRALTPDELAALRELIKRRQAGESVAYLTGQEGVLEARARRRRARAGAAPRHRDAGRGGAGRDCGAAGRGRAARRAPRIADVGTGSGALAITLAKLRAGAGRVRRATFAGGAGGRARERRTARRGGHLRRGRSGRAAGRARAVLADRRQPALHPDRRPRGAARRRPQPSPRWRSTAAPTGWTSCAAWSPTRPRCWRRAARSRWRSAPARPTATARSARAAGFTDVQTRRDLAGIERVVSGVQTMSTAARHTPPNPAAKSSRPRRACSSASRRSTSW